MPYNIGDYKSYPIMCNACYKELTDLLYTYVTMTGYYGDFYTLKGTRMLAPFLFVVIVLDLSKNYDFFGVDELIIYNFNCHDGNCYCVHSVSPFIVYFGPLRYEAKYQI